MRIFRISCPRCGWKSPLPVDEQVAEKFREKKYCGECRKHGKDIPFTIRETIVTGPTQYFPFKTFKGNER